MTSLGVFEKLKGTGTGVNKTNSLAYSEKAMYTLAQQQDCRAVSVSDLLFLQTYAKSPSSAMGI
jgi:hypothetical protein